MSFGSIFCKIFSFLLGILDTMVEFILNVVQKLGDIATSVLKKVVDVVKDVGSALLSSPFGLMLLLVGGFFLYRMLKGNGRDKRDRPSRRLTDVGVRS